MKNPRHLFILVGFLAQSLTWDTYAFAIVTSILWLLAVTRWHHRVHLQLSTEALGLLLGCVASIAISKALQRSAHFFIGDGLVVLQLIRLIRPLNRREKLTSVVIACFHFGVLCTLAPNLRFLILYVAGLYFLPGALKEAFHDRDATPHTSRLSVPLEIQFVPTMRVCLWLLLGSVFVFLTFPRFTGTPLQLRDGFADQASLLDTILDPRRGGKANSQQVLLQVEGIDVGYMRCFSLTEFDGEKWWREPREKLRQTPWENKSNLGDRKRFLPRKVYVKNSHYLGRFVPVDAMPVYMEQTFFTHPGRTIASDTLEAHSMWTSSENTYEYYIDTRARREPLRRDIREHLLFHPPQSDRLATWLGEVTAKGTNALHKARLLEQYLRTNFQYQVGTPELSRLAPTDDFIFNRKEGHCERFAASMALLLRMQGIPSRIAIGYVPTSKNMLSGRMQVRFRDAHSWTEGYFDGLGWVTFDATPGPPPGSQGSDLLDIFEELEFAWYSHVVNFNGLAQRDLAAATTRFLEKLPPRFWSGLCGVFAIIIIGGALRKTRWKLPRGFRWHWRKKTPTPEAAARHYYEEMVQSYARRGIDKNASATPFEFLGDLRAKSESGYPDASLVTENFCRSYYGGKNLTSQEQHATHHALQRLKTSHSTRHESSSAVNPERS